MKILIALSSSRPVPGQEELKPLADGTVVPLAKVRLRHAFLQRLSNDMAGRIRFYERQSDLDMVKELVGEIAALKEQIAMLDKIRTAHDRQTYSEYIQHYGSTNS